MKTGAVVLAGFVTLAGAVGLNAQAPGRSMILERVIVRVNGEILTQSQLAQRQTDAIRERNPDAQNIPDAAVAKLLVEVTPDALVDSVDELLISQRGKELGAKFTDDLFKDALTKVKETNKLDDESLKKALQQEGITLEQLRQNFEKAYLISQVQQQEIFRKMNLTEEELRQYYAAHKDDFVTPETVTLRELVVSVPIAAGQQVARAEDTAAARTKAESIRARAQGGEDFAAMVSALSDGPTKANGGVIGPVDLRDINPAVKALVDSLKPGEISAPISSPRAFQLLKLEARAMPALEPFDKVKDQIAADIRNSRLGGELEKLKARLRAQAVIEWKDEDLKKIYVKHVEELASAAKTPAANATPAAK